MIMALSPFFVFCLMAGVLAKIANTPSELFTLFQTLGLYTLVVVLGLAILLFGFYPLLQRIFGVKFSYPLGNRSAKSQLAASRLEAAQLILSIKELEKEIILEVREAIRQLKTDVKRVQASRIAKRLSEKKLKAEEKKFEVGLSTSFNVLEFQEDLAEQQSNEIKAIIDYNQSKTRFHQVMASTLKTHDIKLQAKENS